jgi:hypothetical protein
MLKRLLIIAVITVSVFYIVVVSALELASDTGVLPDTDSTWSGTDGVGPHP